MNSETKVERLVRHVEQLSDRIDNYYEMAMTIETIIELSQFGGDLDEVYIKELKEELRVLVEETIPETVKVANRAVVSLAACLVSQNSSQGGGEGGE